MHMLPKAAYSKIDDGAYQPIACAEPHITL
jgi:hypothetical protein